MARKIGSIFVDLRTRTAKFMQGMDRASNRMRRFGKSANVLSGQIKTLLGISGGIAFGSLIKGTLDAADQIDKLSIKLGASTEALSQYKHVAELSGVSFQTLTMAWQRMTRRVAEAAAGTGEAKKALQELGLPAKQLAALKPEEQFEVIADALSQVSSQSDKLRLAFKLFDSEGVSVLQTMETGSAGLREMRMEADRLGVTLSEKQTKAAAAAKNAFARLQSSMLGVANATLVAVGPALEKVANWLSVNIPKAIKFAADAFNAYRHWVLEGIKKILEGLGSASLYMARFTKRGSDLESALITTAAGYNVLAIKIGEYQKDLAIATGETEKFNAKINDTGNIYNNIYNPALKTHEETQKKITKAQEEYNKLIDEGKAVYEATRTPAERLSAELERLGMLLEKGVIDWDTYSRAVFDAQDEFEKMGEKAQEVNSKMSEFAVQAARDIQNAFSDFLFDPFDKGVKGLLDSFSQALRKMAAEMAASQLSNMFFGDYGKTGNIGGLAGSLLGNLGIQGFAHGGSFTVGGSGGIDSKLVAFAATPGEKVTVSTPGHDGGGVSVVNHFHLSQPASRETQAQVAAKAGQSIFAARQRVL